MTPSPEAKTILIIGGGIAGLAAGCYAQMNGFRSTILEQHRIAGGLCTAWRRKGYTFDCSMHIVFGTRTGSFNRIWRELGILHGRDIVYHPNRGLFEWGGESFVIPAGLEEFEAFFAARSPQDAPLLAELKQLSRQFADMGIGVEKPIELYNPLQMAGFLLANLSLLWSLRKVSQISLRAFAARAHDPLLRALLLSFEESPSWRMPDVPLTSLLSVLGSSDQRMAGYVVGGSYAGAQAVAQRYVDLGGTLRLRTRVVKILTRTDGASDRAVGVRLEDGSELFADYVISAADGRTTLWDWLDGRYLDDKVTKPYREWKPVPPLVQVVLGVARAFNDEVYTQSFPLARPIRVGDHDYDRMDALIYNYDPTMAPPGKCVVQVWYATEYTWWRDLYANRSAYAAEKARIADAVIAALDARWPGLREQVEVVDVATPVTYERYTGNLQGSPDGWCSTMTSGYNPAPAKLPGLSHFYMAGQWTMPFAGVPGSTMSGRNAIQYICRDEKQRFVTSEPPAGWTPKPMLAPNDDEQPTPAPGAQRRAVAIDAHLCSGCGDCAAASPEVFHMGEDGVAHVDVGELWPEVEAAVLAALEACPEHAIHAAEPEGAIA